METDIDKSTIYAISIASIKRHTMKLHNFEFTKVYSQNTELSDIFQTSIAKNHDCNLDDVHGHYN